MHERAAIDVRNGLLATPRCPARVVEERTFERFDGPFASWAHAAGRAGPPTDVSPLCGGREEPVGRAASGDVAIRYPHDGARFVVDPERPRAAQAIPLKVDAPATATVTLFVDGRLAGQGPAGGAPVYWSLERGAHTIVAEVSGARSRPVRILVE